MGYIGVFRDFHIVWMGWNNQPAKDLPAWVTFVLANLLRPIHGCENMLFLAHFFQHETSSNVEKRLKRARQELTMNGEQQNEPWWNAVDSWDVDDTYWVGVHQHTTVSILRSSNLTMKNPLI